MALVIVITPILFPSARRSVTMKDSVAAAQALADTMRAAAASNPAASTASSTASSNPSSTAAASTTAGTDSAGRSAPVSSVSAAQPSNAAPHAPVAAESIAVRTSRERIVFTNYGAAPASVSLTDYPNLRPGRRDSTMLIAPVKGPLLRYRLALGADTIALDTVPFSVTSNGATTTFTSANPAVTLSYTTTDGLRTEVRGTVPNATPGAALLIDLPNDFRSNEADTLDDQRYFAYGYRIAPRDPESVQFSKLEPNEVRADTGRFQWVNARSKYLILALMQPIDAPKPAGVFHDLIMHGGPRAGRVAPHAAATTIYPIANGQIAFDMYVGPQKFGDLQKMGNNLEAASPYAGFLRPVVQPFATIVMKVLLWMKATLRVNYGWVLVVFGVVIRLALWPLNQKAMKTSMQMQRLQPELADLQKKYKNDPEKQREAMVKLYSSHGMSPFSPMLGCFPMLLPMPILYALYYVFRVTVEFRGVSFLWLPDISLKDPYYILPILMGASMFVLSWIGMRAAPPNPQTKMMSYMMPVMFTVMFLNLASGLNLYYAVQNFAALPQQWLIARQRAAMAPVGTGSAGKAPTRGG
jgi:YidC/Oxa1 family membrane protein insertase